MQKRWNLLNTLFLLGTLAGAVALVPLYLWKAGFHWGEWIACAAMVFAIGTAISAGYHRLFSHRAYKASRPVRLLWLVLGAASFENSALKWSSDHRIHHRHVDDLEKDPYAIGKGFWYAHWTWVMEEKELRIDGVADLQKDPDVMWQHRNHFLIGAVVSSIPLWIGFAVGNPLGYAVVGVLLRIVLTHHTTFFINSAAHVFGTRPYTEENSARDNWFLAPLTYGEGFHNFHHMWQWDYRNGALWYQWDSTKWILNGLAWMGLVSDCRRVPESAMKRARLVVEEQRLARRLAAVHPVEAHPVKDRLAAARVRLDETMASLHERREAWARKRRELKVLGRAKVETYRMAKAEWKESMARYKAEMAAAYAEWKAARRAVRMVLAKPCGWPSPTPEP
jgi:stearoyl-CoA desaturase (delta-9 desaturase)